MLSKRIRCAVLCRIGLETSGLGGRRSGEKAVRSVGPNLLFFMCVCVCVCADAVAVVTVVVVVVVWRGLSSFLLAGALFCFERRGPFWVLLPPASSP